MRSEREREWFFSLSLFHRRRPVPIVQCEPQTGGYSCSCQPTYRYPSKVSPVCQPIRVLNEYPTWHLTRTRRAIPRPNFFEKLRSLIFNRPSSCPPWSHIALLPVEDKDDDHIRFVYDLTRHVDRVARPFTLQAVRLAHLFSSYFALYRPDRDPANDGFLDRRPDPIVTEQLIEAEVISTGLAFGQLLEVGIYLNGSEYERQNPFQQQGEFGYRTSVFRSSNFGLAFVRFDPDEEKFILNRTLDGSYLQEGSWFDKAMQMRTVVETKRYTVSMTMRRDLFGTQSIRLAPMTYDAPTTGVW